MDEFYSTLGNVVYKPETLYRLFCLLQFLIFFPLLSINLSYELVAQFKYLKEV